MAENVSYLLAFGAGFLSFVSPCVLPLLPSYFCYLTGLSSKEIQQDRLRAIVIKHAVMFILGFSILFILLGASATFLGKLLLSHQEVLRKIGGALIIVFGLYMIGLIRPALLMRDLRFHFQEKPSGLIGSFLIGIAFGAGWTPCVGPILGTILLYASLTSSVVTGIFLLAIYALGLAVPFFVTACGANLFLKVSGGRAAMLWINRFAGLFLVIMGGLIFTNALSYLTAYLAKIGLGTLIGQ